MVATLAALIDALSLQLPDGLRESGLLVLGLLIWLGARRCRIRAPHLHLGAWESGEAWFTGKVQATGKLQSPYLRRPCVLYAFDVGDQHQQAGQPFILEDRTGRVLVMPDLARFVWKPAFSAQFKPDEPDPGLLVKLGRAGVTGVEDLVQQHPRLRITESLLPPEATVRVRGTLRDPVPEDHIDPAWGIQKVLAGGEVIVADVSQSSALEPISAWGLLLTFLACLSWGMAGWFLIASFLV